MEGSQTQIQRYGETLRGRYNGEVMRSDREKSIMKSTL